MRKGITPIIAIIILLLITVALAGAAWTFLSGYLGTMIGKSFMVPPNGAFCTNGTIIVTVSNTGNTDLVETDFIVSKINGGNVLLVSANFPIPKQQGKVIIEATGYGSGSGPHTVDLGTSANTEHLTVTC